MTFVTLWREEYDAGTMRPCDFILASMKSPTTLSDLLAARRGTAGCLIDRDRPLAYGDLEDESRRVAHGLAALGVQHGDRVALWLPNVPAWLACFFACARLGAIALAVNTRFRGAELADIIDRAGVTVLVMWPGYRDIDFAGILASVDPAALSRLETVVVYGEGPQEEALPVIQGMRIARYRDVAASPAMADDRAKAGDGCVIFTTSGTTRAPKFVLHSHAGIIRHAADIARSFGLDARDACSLLTVPLCGVFGFCLALATLHAGRTLAMLPAFDADATASAIRRHRVTHMLAVADIVAQLLRAAPEERPFPALRMVVGARHGQAAPAERRGLHLVGVYGSSELQAMLSRQASDAAPEQRELGGGSMVAADAKVRARDAATGAILPDGAQGELEFLAPSRMIGYFGDPDATQRAFTDDGYFRSGDLGYTVPGGYVFVARMGDALRLSGFLVNPLEIEAVIDRHPAVAASQVVGVEGARGLQPVAFVIPSQRAPLDEADVISYCRDRMAHYKVPARILTIDAFPVTPSANGNKIQKARLRELAQLRLRDS